MVEKTLSGDGPQQQRPNVPALMGGRDSSQTARVEFELTITNKRGIHAEPSTNIWWLAHRIHDGLNLRLTSTLARPNGETANLQDLADIMGMEIGPGEKVLLAVEGSQPPSIVKKVAENWVKFLTDDEALEEADGWRKYASGGLK